MTFYSANIEAWQGYYPLLGMVEMSTAAGTANDISHLRSKATSGQITTLSLTFSVIAKRLLCCADLSCQRFLFTVVLVTLRTSA